MFGSNRFRVALIVVAAAMVAATLVAEEKKSVKWQHDFDRAAKEARKTSKPIMVDFYTDWCGWCKKLDKDTYSDSRVIEMSRKFVCVKVDGDKNADLVRRYEVRGYPTIVFLNSKSKEVHRVVGYERPDDFLKSMKEALRKVK